MPDRPPRKKRMAFFKHCSQPTTCPLTSKLNETYSYAYIQGQGTKFLCLTIWKRDWQPALTEKLPQHAIAVCGGAAWQLRSSCSSDWDLALPKYAKMHLRPPLRTPLPIRKMRTVPCKPSLQKCHEIGMKAWSNWRPHSRTSWLPAEESGKNLNDNL